MKKYLLLMLVGFVFLFSCKKDHSKGTNPTGQKYTVNFTVSDVVKATASANKLRVNSAADTFKKYIKNLRYLVYDSSSQLVRQINQDTTTSNFGNISDGFAPGTYNVVFIANATYFIGSQPTGTYGFTGSLLYSGLFYKSIPLTVSNSNISLPITLDRLNAQVQIKATDIVPAVLDSIKFKFSSFDGVYTSIDGTFTDNLSPRIFTHVFTAAEKGMSNFVFAVNYFNTVRPFSITVTRYGKSITAPPIIINNVTCVQNKITILTGKLFQFSSITNQNAGFQISFDPDWGNDQLINF